MDHPTQSVALGGGEHVAGSVDVDSHVLVTVPGHPDFGCEMHDNIAARQRSVQRRPIAARPEQ